MEQQQLPTAQSFVDKIKSNTFINNIFKNQNNVESLLENVKECSLNLNNKIDKLPIITDIPLVEDKVFVSNENLFNDIEFFNTYTSNEDKIQKPIFDVIANCSTYGGKNISKRIYSNPLCNYSVLHKRTKYLKSIEDIYNNNKNTVEQHIEVLKNNEHYVIWLLEEKEDNLKELYDIVFFRFKAFKQLNNSSKLLTAYNLYRMLVSPIFGILSPIIYFFIPYLVLIYKLKLKISFTTYIRTIIQSMFSSDAVLFGHGKILKYIRLISYLFSTMFYFQGIFSSVELGKTIHKISKLLIENLNGVIRYLKASKDLCNMFWTSDVLSYINDFNLTSMDQQQKEQQLLNRLEDKNYHIFSNFGKQLKSYKNIDTPVLCNLVKKSYILDALLGAVRHKQIYNYCYANYLNTGNTKPVIKVANLVHPCIDSGKSVPNDIDFLEEKRNAIITAPNSSGKSVLIKSVVVSVLMAQTMGISSCTSCSITPFKYISTQINVPDSTGFESLFEAEMHRCKHILDNLKILNNNSYKNNYSLIIMDEIFNSTNPIEAVSGAYAVCKKLASFQSNMLIFTTHYSYLTKLAKTKCDFKNYRMQIFVNDENIKFTYKIENGVNKHLLALELLKKSGFDQDIIEEAIEIKKRLQK